MREPESGVPPGIYQTTGGTVYKYTVQGCAWDLDHPDACLFTFIVKGPGRSFEKVIAVGPDEVPGLAPDQPTDAALRAAESKLFRKLDSGNEADEPTPLR